MTPETQGFYQGYLCKSAAVGDIGVAGLKLSADTVNKLLPIALAAPVLAGAGGGYIHSKATSPSEADAETMQQELELAELNEMEASLRRQRELGQRKERRGQKGERSLRI